MAFRATIEVDGLEMDLAPARRFAAKLPQLAFQEVETTVSRLTSEINQGKDADGKKLKAYSPSYKKAINRARKSKKTKGGSRRGRVNIKSKKPTPTNLRITGDLLGSRQTDKLPNGARNRFRGKHYGGLSNQQLAGELERKGFVDWHAFGKKDVDRISKRVTKECDKMLRGVFDLVG